ncbi:histidine kinase dimerization/phosphoacceptor domain -containing protein [Brevundimonas sp.]|jgi:chemotaxis family two-component system sensor kinase Cph1|uniref:histidine kinase dimerization/phosphoacceptor domain -containing protein n=1 Tax=Brevundimonas sp. TaxID=1871086 RepID=UPI0037C11F13
MTDSAVRSEIDLTDCDREPIHVPQAIQPHGFLLVLDLETQTIEQGAGLIEDLTGKTTWTGQPAAALLGDAIGRRLREMARTEETGFAGRWRAVNRLEYDVVVHFTPGQGQGRPHERMVVEVEQSSQQARLGVELIARLDAAGAALERAGTVQAVCERAADAFRKLTGFERIMIYRFLDDEAGQVVAESRTLDTGSFLNHHFPATDIPRQARALYLRNPVRVIPDSHYRPQPLRPIEPGEPPLDMSDSGLRSVSPVHLQYLKNMGVRASASVSIIVDDVLWGLVACHSATPQLLPYELRVACTTLARTLARQLKTKADAELYRERVRLRRLEDELIVRLPTDRSLDAALAERSGQLTELVGADGLAIVRDGRIACFGHAPPEAAVRRLSDWLDQQPGLRPVSSNALSTLVPEAEAWRTHASGLLAVRLPGDQPLSLLWFRSEILETVRWAGNPSTANKSASAADGALTPRASFEEWSETVSGRARRWSAAAVESAARLRDALSDFAAVNQLRTLNQSLQARLSERDLRLEQQQFLMREVNHRVQNSLTLVSSFLGLQARDLGDSPAGSALQEARRRVRAVSTVHTRLYRGDQDTTIDMSRYIGELVEDLGASMGADWAAVIETDLAPVCVDAGRAVTLGLILTELIINAQKYAYDGRPGPLRISLTEADDILRLAVADEGKGGHKAGKGFGSMMIGSLVGQLDGVIDYRDQDPGLEVVLKARIDPLT